MPSSWGRGGGRILIELASLSGCQRQLLPDLDVDAGLLVDVPKVRLHQPSYQDQEVWEIQDTMLGHNCVRGPAEIFDSTKMLRKLARGLVAEGDKAIYQRL